MRIGRMDRRITLRHMVESPPDANRSSVQTYAQYDVVWAEKVEAGGREYYAAQQVQAEIATRFRIRYRSDVLATDRISFDGRDFNITHIQELGRREALMLFATAVRGG